MTKKQKDMFENIYDLMKGVCVIDKKEILTDWEELSLKYHNAAKRKLARFIQNKKIEWDGDNNTISVGKNFTIKLIN